MLPSSVELRIVAVDPSLRKRPPPSEFDESLLPSWIGYGLASEFDNREELSSIELWSAVSEAPPFTKMPPPDTKRPLAPVVATELPSTREFCSESDAPEWTAMPPPFDCAGADAWLSLTVEPISVIDPHRSMPPPSPNAATQGPPAHVAFTLCVVCAGDARLPVTTVSTSVTVVPVNVSMPPPVAVEAA